ncbi:matrixin family metalloprotease [Bacillus sp. CRN 9]|nr:matrixin family metalloprotease [Bacillus sp. CRN 9]
MKKSISFALCFIFLFAVAQQTYAYALLGGKHKTNNLKFRITDFNGTYDKVGKPLNNAIADWNATSTKISFTSGGVGSEITIKAKNFGNVSWSGRCTNYRDLIIAGNYTGSVIEGNLYYLNQNSYSANKVKGVWGHELGHALGLAHVNGTNRLMYSTDARTVYKPTSDEINGVNSLYK